MDRAPRANAVDANGNGQAPPPMQYPQTKLNKIRVYQHRAHYDFETVHAITDASLVSHVSFIAADDNGEPTPITLPLTAVLGWYGDGDGDGPEVSDAELARQQQVVMRQGLMDVYLHGNAAAMLYRAIRDSAAGTVNVCICSTKVDGLVLFPTPNGHSLNYRSSTIHGVASLVPDTDVREKHWAMRLLTNHIFRGRWGNTYPVCPSAVSAVKVIKVRIRSASAKIRTGNTGPFDPDKVPEEERVRMRQAGKGVWSGVLPLFEVLGSPVRSDEIEGIGGDEHGLQNVQPWKEERNARERTYAESLGQGQPGE